MATRIYCDNCGNTCRNPQKYCFGSYAAINYVHYVAKQVPYHATYPQSPNVNMQANAGLLGATPTYSTVATTVATPELVVIDLCDHCTKIWMTRVENLTKVSDVQSDKH